MHVGLIAAIAAGVWLGVCAVFVGAVWLASGERVAAHRGAWLEVGEEFLRATARAQRALPATTSNPGSALAVRSAVDAFRAARADAAVRAVEISAVFGPTSLIATRADEVMQALTAYGLWWGTLDTHAGWQPGRWLDPELMLAGGGLADQLAASSTAFAAAVWAAVDGPIAPACVPPGDPHQRIHSIFQVIRHPTHRASHH